MLHVSSVLALSAMVIRAVNGNEAARYACSLWTLPARSRSSLWTGTTISTAGDPSSERVLCALLGSGTRARPAPPDRCASMRARFEPGAETDLWPCCELAVSCDGRVSGHGEAEGQATAAAAARPATRPENRHPPRKVPSSARYPCMPPPPNPATSPAAYTPARASPDAFMTRPERSVSTPPNVLRVRIQSL